MTVGRKYRGPNKKFWQDADGRKQFFNLDILNDPALINGDTTGLNPSDQRALDSPGIAASFFDAPEATVTRALATRAALAEALATGWRQVSMETVASRAGMPDGSGQAAARP